MAIALVRPLARAIHWLPLLAVTPIVPALAGLFGTLDDGLPPSLVLVMLRAAGLLLGAAAAYVLTDQMAASTAAVPSPRWLRQWLRTTLALAYAAAAWTATYAIVAARSTSALPRDTTVEAAVCVTTGLAGAAFAVRRIPERHTAATAGAATLFTLLAGSLFLPPDRSPWPAPGTPHWDTAHTGWLLALPVALAVLAIAHRDTRTA